MIHDRRFIKNKQFLDDIQQKNLGKYVNPLIKSGYCSDDIIIDTTKVLYILALHELNHVLINIPFKEKRTNKFICEVDIFISISDRNIKKKQIIDFFADSKGKIDYKIEEMHGSTIGLYDYYNFEIKYDILLDREKEQSLCYAYNDTFNELYYLIGVIDENYYYTMNLDFDESA